MEALIVPIALVILPLLALRFGHDSRPGIDTHESHVVDTETRSVLPDIATPSRSEYQRTLVDAPLG
jgi:hypothetical protein